nr:MAG TPA: hypothetical protein [Caudoviricetes sp.]
MRHGRRTSIKSRSGAVNRGGEYPKKGRNQNA